MHKPVFPLADTDGDARKAYRSILDTWYRIPTRGISKEEFTILNAPAPQVVDHLPELIKKSEDILHTREVREMLDRVAKEIAGRFPDPSVMPPIVVDPNGSDLRSISAAIRRADAGARILVKGPAEYRESLFIDKPLQIIGEPGVTLVGINGPAITCTGSLVRITRMRITSEGFNGVIISGGYCVLEQAEVSGTRSSDVLIRDGAEGAIIQCSLHHAEHCGLHAQHGSKCTIVSSTIRENHIGGLFFSQDAEGLVEGNLIERNEVNGIYIAAGANPRIRYNRIRHHAYAGILVYRHSEFQGYGPGRGIIEDNEISEGGQFGIEITEGGDPCVRRNMIQANAWGGIWTHEGGCGTIYENRIVDNVGAGIKNEGGHPRLGRNIFSGNGGQPLEDHGGAIQDDDAHCDD
jgi:parallel beta-helix repeat protein